jgi:MarR family transcriptional regulator, temperature-dependent positive regulator of motility
MVLLTRLARSVYRRSTEEILGMRLKPYVALSYLRDRDHATQQELGEKLMVDPNNLVLLLNELEAAGYVVRRRDQDDRRRHIVELTAAGGRAVDRAERGMESVEDDVLGSLSGEDRATLRRLLSKALEGAPQP